jgi:hypothetical protein
MENNIIICQIETQKNFQSKTKIDDPKKIFANIVVILFRKNQL